MDKSLRTILWILVGLVILSSFSTGWFFIAKQRLCDDYLKLESLFKETMDHLSAQLTASNNEKVELASKLDGIERQLKSLEADKNDVKSKYENVLSEREDLRRELASAKKGKAFLENRIHEMESEMFVANLLKDKVSLEVERDRLKKSLIPKDEEIDKLKSESMEKDVRLSKLETEKNLIDEKLKDAGQVAEILSRDLLKEKESVQAERQEFEKSKIEANILKTRISELEEASREYNRLFAEREDMKIKLSKLESDLNYKDHELEKLKIALAEKPTENQKEFRAEAYHKPEEVELPPIVLSSGQPKSMARLTTPSLERIGQDSSLKGRIVTVNRDHNFVVIDLGKQDGIGIGNRFDVYRGDMPVGSLEVIQTRDRIAAADIKDVREGLYIEINDIVVKR